MPGLFDDIAVPAQPAPKGIFDDIPAAEKPKGRGIVQALKDYPAHVVEGLLNIPKAAIESSQERVQGGDYDPAPIVDAALLGVGPSVAGVRLRMTPKAGETPKSPPETPKAVEPLKAAPEAAKPEGMFDDIPVPPIKEQVVNLSDDLQRVKQSGVADRAEIGNRIATSPKEVLDKDLQEKFYHAIEDPEKMAALSPQERALFDQHIQPLRDEANQLYNTIKNLGGEKMVDDPTYVHRIAKGHAPQYDTLSGEAANPIAGTKSLSKTTSALKERKFYAIENAEGRRFVVSRDADGGVSVWKDGKPTKIRKEADLQPGTGMEIGGQDWEVKQARTSEIEANSSVRYYKNAMLNTADAVVRMREVARNMEFLEKTKSSPWWLENATRVGGNKKIPAGWRQPKLPQLHDWYVNPKLANVLDDFYKPGVFDANSSLRKVNQFAIGSIFWNPLPHIENVAAHWFTGRGWDWIRPGPIRHFATDAGRAIQAVVTQNKLYQDFLREGGGLVYGGVKNAEFYQAMGRKFGMGIEKNWGAWHPIAKKLGFNKPGEFIAWWYGKVRNVLWAANDIFMMHRYLELERKGMPRGKAIKEAEKHIPNYRIPPEVLGSRTFSQILQEPGITVFSRYHYGMWKSYMNLITDMAKGSTKEKIDALGNMAALGFLLYGVYPALDYALQKLTGDPKAQKLRRGAASVPNWTKEMYDGDLSFPQFLSNTITLAPATKEGLQQFTGKDWFTGQDLGGVVPRVEHAAGALVSPYQTANQLTSDAPGSRNAGRGVFDQLVGAANTSERTLRGKQKAKQRREAEARRRANNPHGLIEKGIKAATKKVKSMFGGPVE